ncbi:pkd2, partial [Symbiodinium pilosum]
MAGSMLTYSTLMSANEGTETQAMKIVATRQREKLMGCLMLPLAFVYFVLFCTSIMLHEDISDVYMIESNLRGQMDDIFGEVEDMDSLWDAIQGDFSDIFFKQTDMYGRTLSKNTTNYKWGDWGRVNRYNQIQGAIRFQQTRNVSAAYGKAFQCNSEISCFLCRSNRGFQPAYLNQQRSNGFVVDCGNWTMRRLDGEADMEDVEPEGRQLSPLAPPMLTSLPREKTDEMHVFRFYLYPSEAKSRTMERLQYFRNRVWLDKDSEVLQIRLYLLNAELGQPNMEQVTLTFFMSAGGSIYYRRDFQAIFFEIFPNMSCMVGKKGRTVWAINSTDVRIRVSDGLFFCVFVFTGALQVVVLWRVIRDKRLMSYLKDIRSLLEVVVIIIGLYFCYQFYAVYQTKERTTDIVNEVRARGWDIHDDFQPVLEQLFDISEAAAEDILSLRLLAANYTLILTFRFFANFRAQPQLAIITKTLGALIVEIIHFIVVFIPAFLIYVTSATLLFGRQIEDVCTFGGSLGYIFRMAQEGEFDWETMQEENYWSSAIWVWSFVVFVNMLLINLLIAIILDTYKEVQRNQDSKEAVWNTLYQFWNRLISMRSWVNEQKIVRKCSEPYHPDLLEPDYLKEVFPSIPEYQLGLLFKDTAKQMEIQSDKDIKTEKLVKMAGSLMMSVGGVNSSLKTMMEEESKDPLQSWVVGKPVSGDNKSAFPVQHKGNVEPRIYDPTKVEEEIPEGEDWEQPEVVEEPPPEAGAGEGNEPAEAEPVEEEWKPIWLREVDTMLKAQRSWLLNASWHLE